jgi:hypothetical protein
MRKSTIVACGAVMLSFAQASSESLAMQSGAPATSSTPAPVATASCVDQPGRSPETPTCADRVWMRVSESFSAPAIDTPLSAVRDQMTLVVEAGCEPAMGGCDWRDANGVRHYFHYSDDRDPLLVIKSVNAGDFVGRPIPALGIGTARNQADVLANVQRFLPGVTMTCNPETATDSEVAVRCSGTVVPGFIAVQFDRDGALLTVQFEGYHFT